MGYELGDIVLCTVTKIVGTTVFVKIEDDGEGSIITSEIAPGRIRNLRDYVVPNKKIVCKIMRILEGRIDLSLRRVSEKERREVLDKYEKERNSESILRIVLKEKFSEILSKIKSENKYLNEFLQKAKDNPDVLDKFIDKEESQKIVKILKEKKEKHVEVKKEFSLTCKASDGVIKIKNTLENTDAKYLGSSKFQLSIKANDFKQANAKIKDTLDTIEKKAKQNKCEFSVKEK